MFLQCGVFDFPLAAVDFLYFESHRKLFHNLRFGDLLPVFKYVDDTLSLSLVHRGLEYFANAVKHVSALFIIGDNLALERPLVG